MTLPHTRLLMAMAVSGALMVPALARASDSPWSATQAYTESLRNSGQLAEPKLSLDPRALATMAPDLKSDKSPAPPASESSTLTLAGTGSRIHGFGDMRVASAYLTPRGLLVDHEGIQGQFLFGLVFDLYNGDGFINDVSVNVGTWGDLTSHHPGGDIWSEQDFFAGFDVKFAGKFDLAYTIMAWTFPDIGTATESNPTTEYNMDLKLTYDDSEYLKDFALHPYIDIFWNFAGDSSPVVADALLGRNDHTFYVEIGISPSYTLMKGTEYPITFTLPTYFSFGDSSFWGETPSGDRSNLGVFSTGLKISTPLKFIPADFGNWTAYVGGTYIHTCNPALTYVNTTILDNGDSANVCVGYAGLGFSF